MMDVGVKYVKSRWLRRACRDGCHDFVPPRHERFVRQHNLMTARCLRASFSHQLRLNGWSEQASARDALYLVMLPQNTTEALEHALLRFPRPSAIHDHLFPII
jgi:hypothetical protein